MMLCPLRAAHLSVAEPDVTYAACLQTRCAWWSEREKACAALALAALLVHHLPNIAGNLGAR